MCSSKYNSPFNSTFTFVLVFPGAFGIQIRDPGYKTQPLYNYDIGVNCPNTFNLEFSVPTEGKDFYDKQFNVQIVDSFRTIRMTVFRPAPTITKEQKGNLCLRDRTDFPPVYSSIHTCTSRDNACI